MTKRDLIDEIVKLYPSYSRRDAEVIVNAVFESMTEALCSGERIEIRGFGSFVVEGGKVRYTGFWENDAPVVPLHPHEWWAPRDDGEDNPAGYWALGVGLRCSWMCCRRRKKSEISFRDALAAFEADGPPPVCPRRENLRVHRWQKSRAERMWEDARSNDLDFLCRVWEGGSGWGREGRDGEGEMSVRDRLALGLLRRVAGAVGSGN